MRPLKQILARAFFGALLAGASVATVAAPAAARDAAFFHAVTGTWKGPGQVVAGKYKGTRFVCDLTGDPLAKGATGISMEGHCRVGVFSQEMSAIITRTADGYTGRFLDGAEGKGLDVISGKVGAQKVVVGINRKQLYGAVVASLREPDKMNVTISVKVGERMIPVIGMTLSRDPDPTAVGSID